MCSITTMVADRYRLLEWAEQIKSCQSRSDGMQVKEWCSQNGITKSDYYYRLCRVRQACLYTFPAQTNPIGHRTSSCIIAGSGQSAICPKRH